MKSIVALFIALVAFGHTAFSQPLTTNKIPPSVSGAFKNKFPSATQPGWTMEKANVYEVAFFNGKKRQTAQFDNTGKWLETETEITFNDLPRAVSQALAKNFDGFNVQIVFQLETAEKGILYELEIFKGRENYEIQFSPKGDILNKEAGKEGDED